MTAAGGRWTGAGKKHLNASLLCVDFKCHSSQEAIRVLFMTNKGQPHASNIMLMQTVSLIGMVMHMAK